MWYRSSFIEVFFNFSHQCFDAIIQYWVEMVKEDILVLLLTLEEKNLMFYSWVWCYLKVFSHMSLWLLIFCEFFFNHEEVFVYSLTACISLDFRSLIMMCLGVAVFILPDLSSIYHIFLKFLLAFTSIPWNSSCGVHNVVLNKPFSTSLASFLSLYAGCSSFSHLLNVDIHPPLFFLFYMLPLGYLIHSH